MCASGPHKPTAATRISTSYGEITGRGMSRTSRRCTSHKTLAFIVITSDIEIAGIKPARIAQHRKSIHRFLHADFERRRRQSVHDAADGRVVHRGGDRDWWTTERDQVAVNLRFYKLCDAFDFNCFAVQIENVCARRRIIGTRDKSSRGISDVLKISSAAKTNVKGTSQHGRLHCLRGIAGQAGVAVDAVNSQRTKTDAVDTVIEKVHARIAFVCAFEDAVMRGRFTL